MFARGRKSFGDVYAARPSVAPRGANSWLRESMCRIPGRARRALSILGDLGAALLAEPALVALVAVAVGGVLQGVHRRADQRPVGRPAPDRRLVVCLRSECRLLTSWSLRRLVRPPRGRSRCSSSAKTSRLAAVTVCRPVSVMLTATARVSEGCCWRATMPARSRARTSLETWIGSSPVKSASSRCLGVCPVVVRA
jgi:hypothetical protein